MIELPPDAVWTVIPDWLGTEDESLFGTARGMFRYEADDLRSTGYLYSRADGVEWPPSFKRSGEILLGRLKADLGYLFPICAYQAYMHGSGTEWHTDSPFGLQAILSLGVTRTFGVRKDGKDEKFVSLSHGDLFVMAEGMQQDGWEHRVVPETVPGERISLVFRTPRS